MKNNKTKIGFIIAIISILVFMFYPDQNTVLFGASISCLLGIVASVFGFLAKKELKEQKETKTGYATASIVIGIIIAVLSLIGIAGTIMLNDEELVNKQICPLATDCVIKDENTYTCNYYGTPIECRKESITENNMKK